MTSPLPSLTYLLALSDESSWADLLATLILTDPDTLAGLLGGVDSNAFLVRRDFPLGRGRTVDLVVTAAGRPIVALETSVMEDINPHLLAAIDADFPGNACAASSISARFRRRFPTTPCGRPGVGRMSWGVTRRATTRGCR